MLKNPGTPLIGVAFKADVDIKLIPLFQIGSRPGPVRRVTIRAFHSALYDPVVTWEIEFCLDVQVTGETEIWFLNLQKVLGEPRPMDLMAVITPNRTQFMDSPSKLEKWLLFLVTGKARIRTGFSVLILIFKSEDEALSLRFRMFVTRTVAGLAPFLKMTGFHLQGIIEVWMTPFAGFGSYVPFCLVLRLFLTERIETNEGYRSE
jgi:hypothetical protein